VSVALKSLTQGQVRILSALLQDESVMKGSDLARRSGYKDLEVLALDVEPLVSGGVVHATGPLDGADVFYAVFAVRPSNTEAAQELVRRASEA